MSPEAQSCAFSFHFDLYVYLASLMGTPNLDEKKETLDRETLNRETEKLWRWQNVTTTFHICSLHTKSPTESPTNELRQAIFFFTYEMFVEAIYIAMYIN